MRTHRLIISVLASLGALAAPALAQDVSKPLPIPVGEVQTVNIIRWDSKDLPKVYERSDQLPLTGEELTKLLQAGFSEEELVKMIEERRCNCDASADGLIAYKKAGATPKVIQAVSRHGLRPNRFANFAFTFNFEGTSTEAREGTLYVFVEDGKQMRVLQASLPQILKSRANVTAVDRTDIVRPRPVRQLQFVGQVPLKTYGEHKVWVVASTKPTVIDPKKLPPQDLKNAKTFTFDYPRTSLSNLCRVDLTYRQDAVLSYRWRLLDSRLQCEWE